MTRKELYELYQEQLCKIAIDDFTNGYNLGVFEFYKALAKKLFPDQPLYNYDSKEED